MKIHRCSVNENKITFSGYCLYSRDVWDRVLEFFRQVTAVPVNLCDLYPWVLNGVSNNTTRNAFFLKGELSRFVSSHLMKTRRSEQRSSS